MSPAVVLIPARGGSRRITRKNVRPFLGVPAIQRVIQTITEAGIAQRIVVSTDDEEVARLSGEAGADVPGPRPAGLADDYTTTLEVVRHAIESWLESYSESNPLWVVYPTALLLVPSVLRAADERYRDSVPNFLYSVLRYPHPVERRLAMSEDGRVHPVQPEYTATRTQDFEPKFHDAGQFYVGSIAAWQADSPILSEDAVGFELSRDSVVDIDEPEDWARAEALAAALGG